MKYIEYRVSNGEIYECFHLYEDDVKKQTNTYIEPNSSADTANAITKAYNNSTNKNNFSGVINGESLDNDTNDNNTTTLIQAGSPQDATSKINQAKSKMSSDQLKNTNFKIEFTK